MCNKLCTAELLRTRGIFSEKYGIVIIECRARMLHAAKLEAGKNHEVIFCKRVGDSGVVFKLFERAFDLGEDLIKLLQTVRVCFAVVCADCASVLSVLAVFKFPGGKSEKVCA